MQHFKTWLDQTRIALVARITGGDPRKTVMVYAIATLVVGIVIGAALARPLGAFVLLPAGILAGYAARSFVSYRRRKAFLDARRQS
ncbi:hypothetical protein [Bosea vaviloviae]|uniref:Uncharacterized protein n=1 Tax=Bosea vaviloviae TaxID=1526658 RepID=A0A0N0MC12_9HYPH|nr:hypothetical protein [Bosea vaviloviae]KPH81625.1 hypothetical protein AE618_07755 [Bosea vaviloviae]